MPRMSAIARQRAGGDDRAAVPSLQDPKFSQALERGLAILQCFTGQRPLLGIADVADMLGMSRSTTHRYMTTLVTLGYMEKVTPGRKYRLTLRVTDLGAAAMSAAEPTQHANPFMQELQNQLGFAVSLSALDGAEVVCLEHRPGLRSGFGPFKDLKAGSKHSIFGSAAGVVLVAGLPPERRQKELMSMTVPQGSAVGKGQLRQEIKEVAETGFAMEQETRRTGLLAIAVPVLNENSETVAALSLEAPASQISIEAMADRLLPHLQVAADQISARLGYRRPDQLALAS